MSSGLLDSLKMIAEFSSLLNRLAMAEHIHQYHNGPKPVSLYVEIEKFKSMLGMEKET